MTKIKKIEGFNDYSITDTGKVLSERAGRFKWLKPAKDSHGYLTVTLCKHKKGKKYFIHRLIAEAFISNHNNKPFIDHINGIRDDNRIENLRWCTQKENCNNPIALQRYSEAKKGRVLSDEHRKKLSETKKGKQRSQEIRNKISKAMKGKPKPEGAGKQPKPVIQYTKEGEFVAKYHSMNEASRQTDINWGDIGKCCKGKQHTAGGYKWEYAS